MPSAEESCEESSVLPVDSNFVIFDADDQLALIKRVIREKQINRVILIRVKCWRALVMQKRFTSAR